MKAVRKYDKLNTVTWPITISATQTFVYSGGDTANNNSRENIYPERKFKTDRRTEILDLILLARLSLKL